MRIASTLSLTRCLTVTALVLAVMVGFGRGQAQPGTAPPAQPAPATPAEDAKPPMKQEELEQILAPIALYPDSLLSQMLMAATYPLEIVEAERWVKSHAALKGDALAKELEKTSWDPSVKSMVNFPEVLSSMSEKLDITVKLGDAFIDDQQRVLNTVQNLRAKAQKEGNLKSNEQQTVVVEAAPPPAPAPAAQTVVVQQAPPPTQVIKIESPNPQVVYVPTYSPTVVYGAWPYPTYPPPPYYPPRPPGYVASNMISFGVGVAAGAAWGYAWGKCDWGGGDVDIDVNRNTNINNNIDRSKYQANIDARKTNVQGAGAQGASANSFQHDPSHRKGVAYRDPKTSQQFSSASGANSAKATQAREQYRGHTDTSVAQTAGRDGAGVQNRSATPAGDRGAAGTANRGTAAGPSANTLNPSGAAGDRSGANAGARAGTADRSGANASARGGTPSPNATPGGAAAGNRPAPSASASPSGTSGALSGVERGGTAARADSQRGAASRTGGGSAGARAGGGRR